MKKLLFMLMALAMAAVSCQKENNFDYASLTKWMGDHARTGGWILFIIITIFVITATSNGANLTDGLGGLATGCSAIIAVALNLFLPWWVAGLITLAIGVGKEVYDKVSGKGFAEWKDIICDIIGILIGIL